VSTIGGTAAQTERLGALTPANLDVINTTARSKLSRAFEGPITRCLFDATALQLRDCAATLGRPDEAKVCSRR
jgi:hypothetical protein